MSRPEFGPVAAHSIVEDFASARADVIVEIVLIDCFCIGTESRGTGQVECDVNTETILFWHRVDESREWRGSAEIEVVAFYNQSTRDEFRCQAFDAGRNLLGT